MKMIRRLRYWLQARRNAADLAEEMDFHRAMAGGPIGNATLAREAARAVWIWPWLESVGQDLRYALRNLRRQPGFAVVAVAALGVAIGVNTSLFTVFNAVAIRPWPVPEAGRVVNIMELNARHQPYGFSLEEFRYLGAHSSTISGILATHSGQNVKIGDGRVPSSWVSGSYFQVLRIGMDQGRGFRADEDVTDSPQAVVVVSHAFWRNHLGADQNAVGKTLRIEDVPFTVVGVTGSDFTGTSPESIDLYVPLAAAPLLQPHTAWLKEFLHSADSCCSRVAGRLAPGVSRAQAEAEIAVLHRQFSALRHEETHGVRLSGTAFLATGEENKGIVPVFLLMFLGVTLVLLLACANVGNLLLARAAARQREITVRLSLGATRFRIIRQLLTESLLLASLAGALGMVAAYWLPDLVFRYAVTEGLSFRIVPDALVLIFTVALSVATCLVFGLAPAIHGTRPGGIGSRFSLRSVLLSAQVALSVVLLVGAGLMTRGVEKARTQDPGFNISSVSLATFDLPASSYDAARSRAFFAQLGRELAAARDGRAIGLSRLAPLGNGHNFTHFRLPGESEKQAKLVATNEVNGGYFDVLGIPVLQGRNFEATDADRSVVLVNQAFARNAFGDKALGKTLIAAKPYEIVGVVKDSFTIGLDEIAPTVYFAISGERVPMVLFRSAPGAGDSIATAAKQIDARAGTTVIPLSVNLDKSLQGSRAGAAIAEVLGGFALVLATIGMFGVFAFWVEQRSKEIGIRMALGARPKQVIRLVLSTSSRAVLIGLVLGFAGALGMSRLLQKFLYGLSPFDPVSYALVGLVLAFAGLAATFLPARRATRIDPMSALRCE